MTAQIDGAARRLEVTLLPYRSGSEIADSDRDALKQASAHAAAAIAAAGEDEVPDALRQDLVHADEFLLGERLPAEAATTESQMLALIEQAAVGALLKPEPIEAMAIVAMSSRGEFEGLMQRLRECGAMAREVDAVTRAVKDEVRRQKKQLRQGGARRDDSGLPRLPVNGRALRDVSDEAQRQIQRANEPPGLFRRGGGIVRVQRDERGRPLIEEVRAEHLRGRLVRDVTPVNEQDGDWKHAKVPDELIADLLQRDDWSLPPLEGITAAPVLRSDGTVLDRPGYDRDTRLMYAPLPGFEAPPVPENPTPEQLRAAVAQLREPLADFPFDSQASAANANALVLTPFLRPAIDGPVPLALIDAPQAGTGKTMLAHIVSILATGHPAAVVSAPTREEEMQKMILALLVEGSPLVVFDNVEEPLRSGTLASALTATRFRGRWLGRTETASVEQRAIFVVTGNNLRVRGDLGRRGFTARLDAKIARPHRRRDFGIHPLLPFVAKNRAALVTAALTVGRAWYADGCPPADVPTLGGFEEWAQVVGGVLAHAGVEGFLGGLDERYDQVDEEASEWERFLRAWAAQYGDEPVTAGQVADALPELDALREALPGDLPEWLHSPPRFVRRLGKALSARADRRHGDDGIHVERASVESRGGRVLWRVVVPREPLQVAQVAQVSLLPRAAENISVVTGEKREVGGDPTVENLHGPANLRHGGGA